MKKVICNQMKVIAESDWKHIHGAGNGNTSRSDAMQTAVSGSRGCVAGARDAAKSRGKQ
jgi:hypothetical protein